MAFMEHVVIVVKAVVDKARDEFQKLEQSVSEADRASLSNLSTTQKLGAAWKNMGAAGQAAAIAKVAKEGVDLAVAYDKAAASANGLAKRMGITIEEASRWQVVAQNMGVDSKRLEAAFRKVSIEVEKNGAAFDKWGVQVQKTSSGNTDLAATYLEMVDAIRAIEDPTRKAAAAHELLGKQGGDVLLRMASSTKDWRKELEGVSNLQVFDAEDAKTAAKTKQSVDELKNAWAGLKLALGELLAGPLAEIVEVLGTLFGAVNRVIEPVMNLKDTIQGWIPDWMENINVFSMATSGINLLSDGWDKLRGKEEETKSTTQDTTKAMEDQTKAVEELDSAIASVTDAVLSAFEAEGRYQDALERMNDTLSDKTKSTRDQSESIVEAAKASTKMAEAQAIEAGATFDAAQEQQTLIAELKRLSATAAPGAKAEIDKLVASLNKIPPTKTINVDVKTNYSTTGTPTPQSRGVGPTSVTINMRTTAVGKLAMAREVQAALRAAARWS